jgi:hypothetical protein
MEVLLSALLIHYGDLCRKKRPTPRAPDVWESARFRSIFLAWGFSCSQAESKPAHTQVTQTVSPLDIKKLAYKTLQEKA